MIKKKQLFYSFYIFFLQFYLTILRGKEYFAKLKKNREPEPLKNLPAPQPCW